MTPEELGRLDDQGRRLLGREIAGVAREHIDHTVPATDAHQLALDAEQNKTNMTISEMHQFWIDDCEPGRSTEKDWTKAKERFVQIFGDIKLTEITRAHAQTYREVLGKLRKIPKERSPHSLP
jgi:hypothetical protein